MTLTPYKKLLGLSKEALDANLADSRANTSKQTALLEIAKIDETLASSEQKVTEITSKYPIDFNALLDQLDEVDLSNRRKAQFSKVVAELFPTATT